MDIGERGRDSPIWFGAQDAPLFGLLSPPAGGRNRRGAVICQPIGHEGYVAHGTMRQLAHALADVDVLTLRFDYSGLGDSAGTATADDQAQRWLGDIQAAADVLAEHGVEQLTVIGMRMGGTLAAAWSAATSRPPARLVLWDPCASGKAFLREQQALHALLLNGSSQPTEGVETPGYFFSEHTCASIRKLVLPTFVDHNETQYLVLVRDDRPVSRALKTWFSSGEVEHGIAVGQATLLDVDPFWSTIPTQALERVIKWVGAESAPAAASQLPGALNEAEATFAVDGGDVTERAIRLGPNGMFAILTQPPNGGSGPWIVFPNVSTEPHIGPGRLWVELSRELARKGHRCARFDFSGVGESDAHPGCRPNVGYAREWLDDIFDIADALSPEDPTDMVWIGLCSGAYMSLEAALAVGARGVCAINPILTSYAMQLGTPLADVRRGAHRPLSRSLARLAVQHGRVAGALWRSYRQVAVWQAPTDVLSVVVARGTDLLLLCTPKDAKPFDSVLYWKFFGNHRLRRTEHFEMEIVAQADHGLLRLDGRDAVRRRIVEYVTTRAWTESTLTNALD